MADNKRWQHEAKEENDTELTVRQQVAESYRSGVIDRQAKAEGHRNQNKKS